MSSVPASAMALAQTAAQRACAAADALQGTTYAVISWRSDLPENPLTDYSQAASPRRLLWRGEAWGLADGNCETDNHDGAGRFIAASTSAATIRNRCIIEAESGAPELPIILSHNCFEDQLADNNIWGNIPASRIELPARIRWRRSAGNSWTIRSCRVEPDSTINEVVTNLTNEPRPPRPSKNVGHYCRTD